jgi:hypothetical protein
LPQQFLYFLPLPQGQGSFLSDFLPVTICFGVLGACPAPAVTLAIGVTTLPAASFFTRLTRNMEWAIDRLIFSSRL